MRTTTCHRWSRAVVPFAAVAAAVVAPSTARADVVGACGDIDIDASAQCSIAFQSDCSTVCAPPTCEDACAAKLEKQCDSQCTAQADATCTQTCGTSCSTQCASSPPTFDCSTDCDTRCQAGCSSSCTSSSSSSDDGGVTVTSSTDCQASCGACCSENCNTQCVAVSTTADCNTKCNADCTGSCTASANVTCQEDCQESSFDQCKNDLSNQCVTQCQGSTGAIVCNGSYVAADDVQQCIDALNGILSVQISATGSSSCSGDQCSGSATVTAKSLCSTSPGDSSNASLWGLFAVVGVGLIGARRRMTR